MQCSATPPHLCPLTLVWWFDDCSQHSQLLLHTTPFVVGFGCLHRCWSTHPGLHSPAPPFPDLIYLLPQPVTLFPFTLTPARLYPICLYRTHLIYVRGYLQPAGPCPFIGFLPPLFCIPLCLLPFCCHTHIYVTHALPAHTTHIHGVTFTTFGFP